MKKVVSGPKTSIVTVASPGGGEGIIQVYLELRAALGLLR